MTMRWGQGHLITTIQLPAFSLILAGKATFLAPLLALRHNMDLPGPLLAERTEVTAADVHA